MHIRLDDPEDAKPEIKTSRSKAPWWFAGIMAAITAFAAALSGTSYVQVEELKTDPGARADAWTKTMADTAHANLSKSISSTTRFNEARWTELQEDMRSIQDAHAGMLAIIQTIVSNCAEVKANDMSMQRQLDVMQRRTEALSSRLYSHLGLTANGHGPKRDL